MNASRHASCKNIAAKKKREMACFFLGKPNSQFGCVQESFKKHDTVFKYNQMSLYDFLSHKFETFEAWTFVLNEILR